MTIWPAMMEEVMGKMPEHFARRGAQTRPEFFKDWNRLDWPKLKALQQSKKEVRTTRPLRVSVVFQVYHHFYFASHSTLSEHLHHLLTHYLCIKVEDGTVCLICVWIEGLLDPLFVMSWLNMILGKKCSIFLCCSWKCCYGWFNCLHMLFLDWN